MNLNFLFFICAFFVFSGCSPKPQEEEAVVHTVCDVGEVFAFEEEGWPNPQWWEGFQDASLTGLIEHALAVSPTLAQVKERLACSVYMALQERAHLFPQLGVEFSNDWQHLAKEGFYRAFAPTVPPVVNDVKAGVGIWYVFDFWGKNRALVQAALGEVRAMRAERAQAELVLTSAVAATYVELQGYLCKADILHKGILLRQQRDEIQKRRKEHGLDGEIEVLLSQKDVLSMRAQLAALDGAIAEERHALCALVGEGQSFNFEIEASNILRVGVPTTICMDLIARRPDIAAQRARVESAADRVFVAKTEFYPNIDLAALIGWESVHIHQLFLSKNYSASIKPALHLPFFTAGRLQAQLDAAQAYYNEAVFVYNALVIQAAKEVADALSTLKALGEQLVLQEELVGSLSSVASRAKERMEHGVGDRVMWLEAECAVLDARYVLADMEYSMRMWRVFLVRALGGGYCA